MGKTLQLTGLIRREGEWYVALCPELDIVNQGESIEEARANLREALEGFLEVADRAEISHRLCPDFYLTRIEVAVG